jgi:hypothetical protein
MKSIASCIFAILIAHTYPSLIQIFKSKSSELDDFTNQITTFWKDYTIVHHDQDLKDVSLTWREDPYKLDISQFTYVSEQFGNFTWSFKILENLISQIGLSVDTGYTFIFQFTYTVLDVTSGEIHPGNGNLTLQSKTIALGKRFEQTSDDIYVEGTFTGNHYEVINIGYDSGTTDLIKSLFTKALGIGITIKPLTDKLDTIIEEDFSDYVADIYNKQFPLSIKGKPAISIAPELFKTLPVLSSDYVTYTYTADYYINNKFIDMGVDDSSDYESFTQDDGDTQIFLHNLFLFNSLGLRKDSNFTFTDNDAIEYNLSRLDVNFLGYYWPAVYDIKPRSHIVEFALTLRSIYYNEEVGYLKSELAIKDVNDGDLLSVIDLTHMVKWKAINDDNGINFVIDNINLVEFKTSDQQADFDIERFRVAFIDIFNAIVQKNGEYSLFEHNEKFDTLIKRIDSAESVANGFLMKMKNKDLSKKFLDFLNI